MKKFFTPVVFTIITAIAAALPVPALAAPTAKLPYAKGQRFIVTQGYDTPPTHIKKDRYALDLTQNGCDAYGRAVVAAASGTVMFASQEGYNGGYGTELIIDHGGNIVSRYAHMIPDSITVSTTGTAVHQGEAIGLVGDTGLVAGAACAEHPGTHLHFAMDTVDPDGTFSAYDPEPISGYSNVTAGNWYLSDNGDDDASTSVALAPASVLPGAVLGAYAVTTTTDSPQPAPLSPVPPPSSSPPIAGGVSVIFANMAPASPLVVPASSDATSTESDAASTADIATSTMIMTSTPPAATGTLFAQLDNSTQSIFSWYDDNWFELGNGFAGTLNSLTLEGAVSGVDHFASHVSLQEFKDKDYTTMIAEFPISDAAPFTPTIASTTFAGLSIPLKPYFYYRLATLQDYQNRSVILAGTATTTVGVAMHDNFVYGTGRVEYTSPFFPFILMDGAFATSTLTPPPLTTPSNIAETFDELGMQLTVSFSTSTDPDWPGNPIGYEMNYSTSTTLSDAGWASPAPIPLAIGNTYLIGIRAADSFGNLSAVATATWNFPAGFAPYLLSPATGYAYQYFTVPSTSTLQSIQLFATNLQTNARYVISVGCSLQLFDEYGSSSVGVTPSDNGFNGYDCVGAPIFSFASSAFVLHPDHRYHWVFIAQTGNLSTGAGEQFYGTATNTAGGAFSDPSLANAKFTVTGDTGVLFSN